MDSNINLLSTLNLLCSVKDSNRTCHNVQCGMEKIRAVDERHGLQVQLLIYLAKAFGSKVGVKEVISFLFVFFPYSEVN